MSPDLEKLVGELGGLWRAYASAFQTGDMDSVLPIFAEPCMVHTRLGSSVYMKRSDISVNNKMLLAFYRSQGVVRAEATITEIDPLHRHFVQVFVNYRLINADNADVVSFTTVYGLKQDGERWVIHQVIAQDELEAWAARGTPMGR